MPIVDQSDLALASYLPNAQTTICRYNLPFYESQHAYDDLHLVSYLHYEVRSLS